MVEKYCPEKLRTTLLDSYCLMFVVVKAGQTNSESKVGRFANLPSGQVQVLCGLESSPMALSTMSRQLSVNKWQYHFKHKMEDVTNLQGSSSSCHSDTDMLMK